MNFPNDEEYIIRPLTTDDAEQYNALLRYAFQVTEAELAETGWKDDEIKQSKFPVLQRADVLGCFDKNELIAQFAVYPLDMNIYGVRFNVGFVTSVCTYPEYTGHGIMKKLMIQCLTRMREGHKSFALLYPYSIPLYRNLGWEIISNKMTLVVRAVEAYIEGKNFSEIDMVKRQIISLYEEDFKKIDGSGRISALYHSIPAQLAKDSKKYRITTAIGQKNNSKSEELLYELIDSKTVLPCYNSTNPRVSLTDTKDFDSYKLYLSDTGLFITLMFIDRPVTENDVYAKLLSDKLPANLGYLYENLIAQMITAAGRELYYHTWEKDKSTHYYEVDFLISEGSKVNAFEIKSSGAGKHESIKQFYKKFSKNVNKIYLISQKDVGKEENLMLKPFYLMPFLIK